MYAKELERILAGAAPTTEVKVKHHTGIGDTWIESVEFKPVRDGIVIVIIPGGVKR